MREGKDEPVYLIRYDALIVEKVNRLCRIKAPVLKVNRVLGEFFLSYWGSIAPTRSGVMSMRSKRRTCVIRGRSAWRSTSKNFQKEGNWNRNWKNWYSTWARGAVRFALPRLIAPWSLIAPDRHRSTDRVGTMEPLELFHMYGFFKRYRSSGTVFGTVHAVRGRIEDGTTYFWSGQPCSNRAVRTNGPNLIP